MVMESNMIFHHHYLSEDVDFIRRLCLKNDLLDEFYMIELLLGCLKVVVSLISTHISWKIRIIKESSEFDDSSVIGKEMMCWAQIHLNHQFLIIHWGEIDCANFQILHKRFLLVGWSEIDGNGTDRLGMKSCIRRCQLRFGASCPKPVRELSSTFVL